MDNSVSIDLLPKYTYLLQEIIFNITEWQLKPLPEIKSVRSNYFHFNVNPNDHMMINVLERNGFCVEQVTYSKI